MKTGLICSYITCLVYRYTGTDDSDELYTSFFMVRQFFRLDLIDSEDRSTCPVETLTIICQSTRCHIAEDLDLANIRRHERHGGLWGSGNTASLIRTIDIIWRLGGQLQAPSALLPGKASVMQEGQ